MSFCFILGNHPQLSAWEIIRVLQQQSKEYRFVSFHESSLILDVDFTVEEIQVFASELGGTIKVCVVEEITKHLSMDVVLSFLEKRCQEFGKKYSFGLSVYGATKKQFQAFDKTGIQFKKKLKEKGYSARFVRGMGDALSSVTVAVNGLTGAKGDELVFVDSGDAIVMARTIFVQEYEEWGQRDFGKPKRSMQVGMIPPKLARMMINLSGASKETLLVDPFCGMGTILMEAAKLGFKKVGGLDIEEKQIQSTKENMDWLQKENPELKFESTYICSDVRSLSTKIQKVGTFVTEPYLGKIKKGNEDATHMQKEMDELNALYISALQQMIKVLEKGGTIVMIIPRFLIGKNQYVFDLKKEIKEMGLQEILPPEWLDAKKMIYKREGQFVAREVWVLRRD